MEAVQQSPQNTKSQEASGGPLPAYDLFLRALGDSYLNFFVERLRLEEQYRDAILRLLHRQRNVDSMFDERLPDRDWTLRRAWRDVCDELERETDVRGALINSLRSDIVNPLQDLKETHERSRKRIKEDIKSSLAQYNDYNDSVLPRLKRAYIKRCQEVEEWKAAQEPKPVHTGPTSPVISNPILPKQGVPTGRVSMDAGYPGQGSGNGNGFQPADRVRGRQASIAVPPRRDRSPGGSTNLSDLAHQGRRQLNNLRTLIETKGIGKEGGARTEAAMRAVRAKKDAEEADKEYRRGVHTLETLRIRWSKTLEAGYTSTETLVGESAEIMTKIITRYADGLTATNTTSAQLASTLHSVVPDIRVAHDLTRLRQITSASLAAAIPKRVLYYNYRVGECHDMIFGVSLVDYASSRGLREGEIPRLVQLCISEIESNGGLKKEGIYRISGKHATVLELSLAAERNEREFRFDRSKDDLGVVSSLLKFYLRELPDPVFRVSSAERTQYMEDRERHFATNQAMIRGKIRRLPAIHQATLRAVLEHLAKVNANSAQNKMDAKNLAIVFGPVLLGDEPMGNSMDILTMSKDTLMEDLINCVPILYETTPLIEKPARTPSPPLPNPPEDDSPIKPRPTFPVYGSAHTVVKTLPASEFTRKGPSKDKDSAPALPPRPSNRQGIPERARRVTISSGSVSDGAGTPSAGHTPSRPSEDGRANVRVTARAPAGIGGGLRVDTDVRSHSASASAATSPTSKVTKQTNASDVGLTVSTSGAGDVGSSLHTPSTIASTTGTGVREQPSRKSSSIYANSMLMEAGVLMVQESEPDFVPREGSHLSRHGALNAKRDSPPRTATGVGIVAGIAAAPGIVGAASASRERVDPSPPSTRSQPSPVVQRSPVLRRTNVPNRTTSPGLRAEDSDDFEVDYPGSPDTSALDFKTAENTPVTDSIPLDSLTYP